MPAGHEHEELVMLLAESALAQPPENREQFLRSACGGDAAFLAQGSDCVRRLSQSESAGEAAPDRKRVV